MKDLKYNIKGGIDAILNGYPYTLSDTEFKEAIVGKLGKISDLSQKEIDLAADLELKSKIIQLEGGISSRRYREASLGNTDAIAFIRDIDDQIKALRT